jgi:hypothetical protein
MKTGMIPHGGLCASLGEVTKIFTPTPEEIGHSDPSIVLWGYDGTYKKQLVPIVMMFCNPVAYEFTPLRQTIVLFLAAMNNEL